MAKVNSVIDLTKTNRKPYIGTPWGGEPSQQLAKPQVLLSLYINLEGKIEELKVLDEFVGGDEGNSLRTGYSEDYEYMEIPRECDENDCLYHVYAAVGSYRCSYEYDEWEAYYDFFKVIKVMRNYSQFLDGIADWEDQQKKEREDEGISIMTSGKIYGKNLEDEDEDMDLDATHGGSTLKTNITMRDLKSLITIAAEKDIRLAHRFSLHLGSRSMLGDKFDTNISVIESMRQEVIKYLKYSNEFETRWTEEGYEIESKSYRFPKGKHTITYEEINNITDDVLKLNDPNKIVKAIVSTHQILDVFDKSL